MKETPDHPANLDVLIQNFDCALSHPDDHLRGTGCRNAGGADAGSGGITPEDGCCLFSEPSGELLLLQSVSAGKSVEAGERAVRV